MIKQIASVMDSNIKTWLALFAAVGTATAAFVQIEVEHHQTQVRVEQIDEKGTRALQATEVRLNNIVNRMNDMDRADRDVAKEANELTRRVDLLEERVRHLLEQNGKKP